MSYFTYIKLIPEFILVLVIFYVLMVMESFLEPPSTIPIDTVDTAKLVCKELFANLMPSQQDIELNNIDLYPTYINLRNQTEELFCKYDLKTKTATNIRYIE